MFSLHPHVVIPSRCAVAALSVGVGALVGMTQLEPASAPAARIIEQRTAVAIVGELGELSLPTKAAPAIAESATPVTRPAPMPSTIEVAPKWTTDKALPPETPGF